MPHHRTRAERSAKTHARRANARVAQIVTVALLAAGIVLAVLLSGSAEHVSTEASPLLTSIRSEKTTATDTVSAAAEGTATQARIELPSLVGMTIEDAEFVLAAVGVTVTRTSTPAGDEASGTVLAQSPTAGELIAADTIVELWIADPLATAERTGATGLVVCLDPGHQTTGNSAQEPVGPGATETKDRVSPGATGVTTGQYEYAFALDLALQVKERLEAYGITVVMTRTTNNVDISNAQRAAVANEAGADLFVRIHADSTVNADLSGISTLYPGGNSWVAAIADESLEAATLIQQEMIASTGAKDRGITERSDLSGFNYATVPSVLVETGFMSNPAEDKLLASEKYQNKLADGITRGILAYLEVGE